VTAVRIEAAALVAELRRLYPSTGPGRPKGRPNTNTIRAAIYARWLRAQGLVGGHLGVAVAEALDRDRAFDDEELAAAETALADATDRGLTLEVPPPVALLSAARARRAQALLDRHLTLLEAKIVTPEQELEFTENYAAYVAVMGRPAHECELYEAQANYLRVRLDERAERLADERFERGRERRRRIIERGRREFAVTQANTLIAHRGPHGVVYESVTLEPSYWPGTLGEAARARQLWDWRRNQWQLAEVGEALGRHKMEELAAHQREERRAERDRKGTLSLDFEYSTDEGEPTSFYDLLDAEEVALGARGGGLAPAAREAQAEQAALIIGDELGDGDWHPVRRIRERLASDGLDHPQVVTDAKRHIASHLPMRVAHRQRSTTEWEWRIEFSGGSQDAVLMNIGEDLPASASTAAERIAAGHLRARSPLPIPRNRPAHSELEIDVLDHVHSDSKPQKRSTE
jgi:hypothetical protein